MDELSTQLKKIVPTIRKIKKEKRKGCCLVGQVHHVGYAGIALDALKPLDTV